jgi:hypothetical protein
MRSLRHFELSGTQLLATALAAVTATVAASYLGVAGTVIGAAVGSVLSAIATAVYGHSLRRTHARVREAVPARRRQDPRPPGSHPSGALTPPDTGPAEPGPTVRDPGRVRQPSRWHGAAIGSLAAFVAVLIAVTGAELVTGRPLNDLLRGTAASGTTLFGHTKDVAVQVPAPAPTITRTVVPSVVVTTPTVTQTAPPVTQTATPTSAPSTPAPVPTPSVSLTTLGPSGQPTA